MLIAPFFTIGDIITLFTQLTVLEDVVYKRKGGDDISKTMQDRYTETTQH